MNDSVIFIIANRCKEGKYIFLLKIEMIIAYIVCIYIILTQYTNLYHHLWIKFEPLTCSILEIRWLLHICTIFHHLQHHSPSSFSFYPLPLLSHRLTRMKGKRTVYKSPYVIQGHKHAQEPMKDLSHFSSWGSIFTSI